MLFKTILQVFIGFFVLGDLCGQSCTSLGQNPGTAFPVCGISSFSQQTVPACGGQTIPVPGCENTNAAYGDLNPFWYKFTCFSGGTLGFTITPITGTDDYDWQLFDITGHDASDVYTDRSLYVASNWSANPGATGTAANATSFTACEGYSTPNKSKMPLLIEGHRYLLLVSHFTSINQSGYKLKFDGGTANITDPKDPHLMESRAYCDGSTVILKLNKKMRCNSLSPDGSDFAISDSSFSIVGASAVGCLSGFDMDSVLITLDKPLPVGSFSVSVKQGVDNNTLLDNCDREIPIGESTHFVVSPVMPTPMDSLTSPGCSPPFLELVFRKPILCNSIASDGSDFIITGNPVAGIESAAGLCDGNGKSSVIRIKLLAPLVSQGNYTITLRKGSDGNTIIDECGQETPAGSNLSFVIKDTVSASFNHSILYGCKTDTVIFFHPAANGVNQWNWQFDDLSVAHGQQHQKAYSIFGHKLATLMVSNGTCSDTVSADIFLDNTLKADFKAPEYICPRDTAQFQDASIGNITSWNWSFGNGTVSRLQLPPAQHYAAPLTDQEYSIQLVVSNNLGCADTAVRHIKLVSSCYIDIPSAFTPNGDNLNDYLYPLNAYKAADLLFRVYNSYGQKVFEATDRFKKWDGTLNGKMQGSGTFVWLLEYKHTDTGRRFSLKGTTTLIR